MILLKATVNQLRTQYRDQKIYHFRESRKKKYNGKIWRKRMKIIFNLRNWGSDYIKPKSRKTVAKTWKRKTTKKNAKKGWLLFNKWPLAHSFINWTKVKESHTRSYPFSRRISIKPFFSFVSIVLPGSAFKLFYLSLSPFLKCTIVYNVHKFWKKKVVDLCSILKWNFNWLFYLDVEIRHFFTRN